MNSLKITVLFLFFGLFSCFSQRSDQNNKNAEISFPIQTSKIISSTFSDTSVIKLEVRDALYDAIKNYIPYYSVSKTTTYNQTALAQLVVQKAMIVGEPHASVIKKYFKPYLSSNFELVEKASLCNRENLNIYRLIPFRLTPQGEIEELIDYSINWQITSNENSKLFNQASVFKSSSVLSSGDWYKIAITKTGVYKLDRAFLEKSGISTTNLDPRNIQIYGNGGHMVPELNSSFRYDDLEENAIQVVGENDGEFNVGDYVLFYATGTDEWSRTTSGGGLKFEAKKNLYSDTSFYFITVGTSNGKRIVTQANSSLTSNVSSDSYDYYGYHEDDKVNFGKTGRDFYGEYFDIQTSFGFNWNDGDFVTGDSLMAKVTVATAYRDTTQFLISGNGLNSIVTTASLNVGDYLAEYARVASKTAITSNNTDNGSITVTITKLTSKSIGWLDKLTVNARRKLVMNARQFQFRDSRVIGVGNVCKYTIATTQTNSPLLWNVSDPLNPINLSYNTTGSTLDFTSTSDVLKEYSLVTDKDYYVPVALGKIENQNLHAILQADYVIVTHPLFLDQANRLAAFHNNTEGYTTAVVTIDQIYNEYSSGKQDISAIRDFIRMLYSRNLANNKEVKYVLLMGDGSFNNRIRSTVNNTNFIPTYESVESLSSTSSLATDDFYGLMDPNEGADAEGTGFIDVGIGRFTCKSVDEVNGVINKVENYYKKNTNFSIADTDPVNCNNSGESPMGDWRNNLLFLADDGDKSTHMIGADNLSDIVKGISGNYNSDKIYIDAYQRVSTPGGNRYPDASEDYKRRIKKGVLLFNYTGHGGELGLTAERLLDIATINSMDNFNRLPLFVTATCEFSRYDDPGRTSAGELCLINSRGAAIALLTTCRLAYSSANDILNSEVINKLFRRLPNGKRPTLGDVVRLTKSSPLLGGQSYLYANFHLLGDPALTLSYPEYKVMTSKINNIPYEKGHFNVGDSLVMDTLTFGALEKIVVSGYVADTSGNKLSNFNGLVYSNVFDRQEEVVCLLNDAQSYYVVPGNPFKFELQKNSLFHGKTQVTNGEFSFTFLVPKDISFAYGPGKISYYATNGVDDASGSFGQLRVGGSSNNVVIDNEGPKVDLYLNDKNFVNGSITNEKPILYADVTDSSGINTLGTSFGHDITAVLNKSGDKSIILNDYYEASLNSYQSGRVSYPFSQLSEGDYQLTFKVWDIQNNSSTSYSEFVVANSAELALKHVLNYPNPFTTKTKFFFEHNQACKPLKVTIQIYTISGKVVKTIQQSVRCEGFKAEGIDWDGRDDFGDKLGRGVYIYRLTIINPENEKAEKIEKLVILN